MREKRSVLKLIVLMILATGIVGATVFLILYRAAMSEERMRLTETVKSQARLIESIARHDMAYKPHLPGGPIRATVARIAEAHENYAGFGKTGTFTLARREGDHIEFLVIHSGRKMSEPVSVPWDSNLAQPMRRALSGHSGTMVGLDYQGREVLAAYEPVAILDLGIVAKIDLWEIRAPFIRAGTLALLVTLLVSLGTTLLFIRIMRPIISRLEAHARHLEKSVSDLEKSEERSRRLIERNPDTVLVLDGKGEILFANPASEKLLGRKREALTGLHLGLPSIGAEFAEISVGGSDGVEKTAEMRSQTILWGDQDAHIVSLRDVTERKTAEERIRVLNEALKAIRDVNKLITREKKPGPLIQKACGILKSPKRFPGVWIALLDQEGSVTEVFQEGMGDRFHALRERLVRGNFPRCVRKALHGTDPVLVKKGPDSCDDCPLGKDLTEDGALVVPLVQNGRLYGVLVLKAAFGIAADEENQSLYREAADDIAFALRSIEIEEKQGAFREALRQSEARFRLLVENAPVGILVVDKDRTMRDFNEKGMEILSSISRVATFDNLMSNPFLLRAGISGDIEACFESGRAESHERPCGTENGGKVVVRYYLAPMLDGEKSVSAVQLIMEDISETRSLESQLRQAQKMEAIGTLAGGIAHDFNNILAGILGYSQLVMTDLPEDAAIFPSLQQIFMAGQRARDLVKQILMFSRQAETEPVPLKPHLIVKEAIKLLRSTIPTTIDIRQYVFTDTGMIMADPTQMHQVIMNLSTNAYQSMQESGGTLEITLKNVQVAHGDVLLNVSSDLRPGAYVRLTVKDTGKGIPTETLEHIFDPYFTTKKKGEGTGLGLAVVHGIVADCGGCIMVQSEEGAGATFDVFFPRLEKNGDAAKAQAGSPIQGGDERILMVDDEEPIALLGKQMLEKLGYNVLVSVGSLEAFDRFKADPDGFDLMITDMTMPGMRGDELALAVKKIRPGFPVVICTGYSDFMNEEKAKALGLEGFLMKPLERDALGRIVRDVLDG